MLLTTLHTAALTSPCSWPWRWWRRGWGCSWTLAASGPPAWWRGWLRTDWLWLGCADKRQNCESNHLSWLMNIKTKNTVVIFALPFDLIVWSNVLNEAWASLCRLSKSSAYQKTQPFILGDKRLFIRLTLCKSGAMQCLFWYDHQGAAKSDNFRFFTMWLKQTCCFSERMDVFPVKS